MSENPTYFEVLTPNHFLIGAPVSTLPEQEHFQEPIAHRQRWQLCQSVLQHSWKRWSREYFSQLLQRTKWKDQKGTFMSTVLFYSKKKTVPPLLWRLGRFIRLHLGNDGNRNLSEENYH
ncbi:hypothetical protein X975_19485, partial [Stegodyphus mimosarum]